MPESTLQHSLGCDQAGTNESVLAAWPIKKKAAL